VLFDADDLEEALRALVKELVDAGVEAKIRIVGGAAVEMQVGREGLTEDIDAVYGSSPEVKSAVERIAQARNWPPTWLDDSVKMYMSHHVTDGDWELRMQEEGVAVYAARSRLLLAMKLHSGRGHRDAGDIDRLLDACGIDSIRAAEELFDGYYPEEGMAEPALRQLEERFPESN